MRTKVFELEWPMKCEACEAFEDIKYPETDILIWAPLVHTHSKLSAFLAMSVYPHEVIDDQTLRISVYAADYAPLMVKLRGLLTSRELSGAKAMSVPKGTEPNMVNLHRVVSLEQLIGLSQAEWLQDMIHEDRFTSLFQPIIDAKTNALLGHEALFRGQEKSGVMLGAGPIFQAAKQAGLLFQIDLAGRRSAVETAARHSIGSSWLFINFNPTAIYDPAYCLRTTVSTCNALGLEPEQIVFEVTETEEVEDLAHLKGILSFYRDAGFKVALDDIGAGYSGLTRLADLEPDIIKIDRHLITEIETQPFKRSIVEHLTAIAHQQGIKVLAEGIETEAERDVVSEIGVDYFQGFLFGKPVPEPLQETTAAA